jgi:hypothetical protein
VLEVSILSDSQLALPEYDMLLESPVYDRLAERVTLSAAINEVASFQLMVAAASGAGRSLSVYIEPPRSDAGQIEPEHIVVYRAIPVRVDRAPGWLLRRWPRPPSLSRYYDALAPVQGAVPVNGAEPVPLWVDIRVPHGTAPGIYECDITVTEATGRRTVVPLSLEVWPFALPSDSRPAVLAPLSVGPLVEGLTKGGNDRRMIRLSQYDPNRDEGVAQVHAAARLLHDHGLTVYIDDYRPVMKVEPTGRVRVLWEDYDHLAGPLVDGSAYEDRAPPPYWPIPVWPDFPDPERFGGLDADIFGRVYGNYVAQCATHMHKLSSSGRTPARSQAVLIAGDLVRPTPGAYERFVRLAGLARIAAPDLRLVAAFCPQDMSDFGWYGFVRMPRPDLVDVWAPAGRYFDPGQARSLARQGRQTWLRPDEPGYTGSLMVEAPPLDARSLAWQAWQGGAAAVWLSPVNRWPPAGEAARLEGVPETHADWLIYPGEMAGMEEAIPSVRLKRLRRGLQDVRYLELLGRHGRPGVARLICETLFRAGGTEAYGDHFADTRPYGWVEDPAMWTLARRLMAQQIMHAMAADASVQDPERVHAIELEWRRLQQGCRKLRLFVHGVELQRSQRRQAPELTARAHVCLCNETRRSLVGTLRFGEGLSSWARPPEVFGGEDEEPAVSRVETLPPEARITRRISTPLINLRATADGLRVLPLEFDTGEAGRVRAEARLAYVVPQELGSPLVLDGDLSDWPPGVGHSAGGFRLVGSRPRLPGERGISDLPTQQTRVYVAADAECLYFGFDCREERMDQLQVGMKNFVEYAGMTPVGEDFVEIVLDPTNARTRSTGDLYHLLVKANGVVLSHRGIAFDPPTGPHDLWFSGAAAQVRHHTDGWTAEVLLPRRSLPVQAEEWPIWAINFSRFQARLAEYSNWAGAKRHVYSPLSMGNLIWSQGVRGR